MLTLTQSADQIRTRQLSPVELTRECLGNIERLNPTLNSFITVTTDLALAHAQQAEREIAAGHYRGPLHGIPFALKDNIDTAGILTTAASNQYRDRIPTEDAAIVKQLKLAGAIVVGKTNMHEFAFGGSGVVSGSGPARDPWDPARITGGSSSGTAAAVAAGMCVAAIGTDTAGSIRVPSALCGVVGHRPSRGVLSNKGIIPLAESFDTPGPMARSALDAAIILTALAPVGCPSLFGHVEGVVARLKAGIARNLATGLEPEVATCFEAALHVLKSLVAEISEVTIQADLAWDMRNFEITRYHAAMLRDTPELYDPRTLDRVRGAASAMQEPEYICKREAFKAADPGSAVFDQVDVVISPSVPVTAPFVADLEAMDSATLRAYEVNSLLRNALPFSFLWWPSVSVPCGFTSAGLPVGLQISARPGTDTVALRLALAYERATEWHKRIPAVS